MILEDYISFETAKLLEEKGFDIDDCEVHYDPTDHTSYDITLQIAMKWLREVHKIYIETFHKSFENKWIGRVYNDIKVIFDTNELVSYEEACETAIKYCLENLI